MLHSRMVVESCKGEQPKEKKRRWNKTKKEIKEEQIEKQKNKYKNIQQIQKILFKNNCFM